MAVSLPSVSGVADDGAGGASNVNRSDFWRV
jgi:hypothetical protein